MGSQLLNLRLAAYLLKLCNLLYNFTLAEFQEYITAGCVHNAADTGNPKSFLSAFNYFSFKFLVQGFGQLIASKKIAQNQRTFGIVFTE